MERGIVRVEKAKSCGRIVREREWKWIKYRNGGKLVSVKAERWKHKVEEEIYRALQVYQFSLCKC